MTYYKLCLAGSHNGIVSYKFWHGAGHSFPGVARCEVVLAFSARTKLELPACKTDSTLALSNAGKLCSCIRGSQ